MALNLKKNMVVGVSVTPELGLEIAQVDYMTGTVVKYGYKQLAYDNNRREIADLDIFKGTLQELLEEMMIPKGTEIVVNIPSILFRVSDYPKALTESEISTAIEEDLTSHPIFQNNEACISAVSLPSSTMQFTKVAYTVAQKVMLIEIAMQIKELGYTLIGIDTSVNSTLNALIYNNRVNVSPEMNWVLLLIENNCCRILSMQGSNYIDSFEERISIGEVLGDAENYSIVSSAVDPILKNLPSQCLYVVSKTNVISAKVISEKLAYNAQIIHQEANNFATEPFLEVTSGVNPAFANIISLDVIGAAIYREFLGQTSAPFNLFNESLGDVYILEQPPVLKLGTFTFTLSMTNMIVSAIIFAILSVIIAITILVPINTTLSSKKNEIAKLDREIAEIQSYLNKNESYSTELFDEGDEIRIGLVNNKNLYSYYTIVGTEIPKKLWLTKLDLGQHITIEGQADNLESVYAFFRNIKDYNPNSDIKLQKLKLASTSNLRALSEEEAFDTDSIITSLNADYYEFRISNAPEVKADGGNKGGSGLLDLESLD